MRTLQACQGENDEEGPEGIWSDCQQVVQRMKHAEEKSAQSEDYPAHNDNQYKYSLCAHERRGSWKYEGLPGCCKVLEHD